MNNPVFVYTRSTEGYDDHIILMKAEDIDALEATVLKSPLKEIEIVVVFYKENKQTTAVYVTSTTTIKVFELYITILRKALEDQENVYPNHPFGIAAYNAYPYINEKNFKFVAINLGELSYGDSMYMIRNQTEANVLNMIIKCNRIEIALNEE